MPSLPTINSEKRMDGNRVNSAKLAEMKRERNNVREFREKRECQPWQKKIKCEI